MEKIDSCRSPLLIGSLGLEAWFGLVLFVMTNLTYMTIILYGIGKANNLHLQHNLGILRNENFES